MRYPALFTVIILLFSELSVSGQYYETGQDPSSVKWLQIKTGKFTVVYPESYGKGGMIYVKSLEEAYSSLLKLYPEKKIKIPVLIHSLTTKSNGYVAWAPKRMELYPTPEQNTIPLASEKQLAIHELAHVFQMNSLNRGFSKIMAVPFGEQFTGIVASLLPLWYLEGDAVFAETILTESGRGRTPSFSRQLKAISVDNGSISGYDKILNGSYREFVPDHYESGYQIVAWSKYKYGLQTWNNVLKYTAEEPFSVIPVNISLKKQTRLTKKKLFEETFDSLKTSWTKEIIADKVETYESVNPVKKGKFINYYSPVAAGIDSLIAIKTSLDNPPEFVLINTILKKEKKIHTPGQVYPWVFAYSNGKITWVENEQDPRWENRDFSVIKIMDLKTKKIKRLSIRSRYQAVSISPDGKRVISTENSIDNKNSIAFFDSETGDLQQKSASPENIYLQRPQWSADGLKITFIFLNTDGEGVVVYNTKENSWETLIEAGRSDLQSAVLRNDTLFYVSSVSGTENIFFRAKSGTAGRVTRSKFGATDLSLTGNRLIFSDYSSSGNSISFTSLSNYREDTAETSFSPRTIIEKIKPESNNNESVAETEYSPEPYRKWQHLFNFHSWLPFYADLEEIKSDPLSVRPGFSLMTQNLLSTFISQTSYEYSEDGRHMLHSRITYKGLYPVFESKLDYGSFPVITKLLRQGETAPDPSVIKPGLRSTNTISLPLRFSSGRFTEYFHTSLSTDFRNDNIYLNGVYDYGQAIFSGRVYFSNYYRSVARDIYPRWAQVIDLNYSFAPFDKALYGNIKTIKTVLYFPGILPHSSLKIRYEQEKQAPVKFLYGNRISFPRGYKNIVTREMTLYSADYALPLFYPDLSLSSLLYIKRVRGGVFYDFAFGTGNTYFTYTQAGVQRVDHNYRERFSSTGFEILADFHVLRIPYMISGGVQTYWRRSESSPSFQFIFNIDLYGMTIGKRERQANFQ